MAPGYLYKGSRYYCYPRDRQCGLGFCRINRRTTGECGGAVLTKHDVSYSSNGSTWTTVTRSNATARTETITGLTNGVSYTVRVRAVTSLNGQLAFFAASTPYGHPINTQAPTLTGNARFDDTLIATVGTWNSNGSPISATTYQWQFSNNAGTTWNSIPNATGSTYTVGRYVDSVIRVLVTATNTAGDTQVSSTATSTVLAVKPNEPTDLTVTEQDAQLAVSWTAPSYDGGTNITNYEIEYSTDGNTWNAVSRTASTETTQTIPALTNGVSYSVRVRALNGTFGIWQTSNVRFTPYGAPINTAVPMLSGTTTFDQIVSVTAGSWNENGRAISNTSYQWQYSTDSGGTWQSITGATSATYTIGSHVGHVLRAKVTVTNLRGSVSQYSVATPVVLAASPTAPTSVTTTAGDQQVAVNWNAPSYLGGALISDYQIEYSTDATTWTRVTRTASTTRSQLIVGLTNDTNYDIRVRAFNGVAGEWFTISTQVKPFGLPYTSTPGALPIVSGDVTFDQTLTVANVGWAENGRPITATTYQWQVESAPGVWSNIGGASSATHKIAGFIDKALRAKVTVKNEAGEVSIFSAATVPISPAAASVPLNIRATRDDEALNISWSAPDYTGGAPVTNYDVQISEDADNWTTVTRTASTATSQRIPNLVNGTPYYIRVRALNGVEGDLGYVRESIVPRGLPKNMIAPVIAGAPRFQNTLSVDTGQWDDNGDTISAFTYQWQASVDGITWSNIAGATNSTYAVGLYVGSKLRVIVRATNDAGIQSAYSTASATVTAIPAATPVITSQQVGSTTVRVGWTPPTHSGGVTIAGYTLQYSTDSASWTSKSLSAGETSATLTGLTNGTGYFIRVRAETTQSGEWSPVAGPFTPVAPPAPATPVSATVSASPQVTAVAPSALLTSVMPRLLTTSSITSLTGPSQVTITSDGRIELQPTQTVALLDGAPIAADVAISGSKVSISTGETSLAMNFGSSSGAPTQATGSATSTLVQGSTIQFTGDGFGADSPVVTWIQSNPVKLGEAVVSAQGRVKDAVKIPASIAPGEHTIQINGLDAAGHVVSLIYGVHVVAQSTSATVSGPGGLTALLAQPWLWLLVLLLIAVAVLVGMRTRRRIR